MPATVCPDPEKYEIIKQVESTYISKHVGEALHNALFLVTLYQPIDPIEFISLHLAYWAKEVRRYRRQKIAELQYNVLLEQTLPWFISVIIEKAQKEQQNALNDSRAAAEERARLAEKKKQRVRALTEEKTAEAIKTIQRFTAKDTLDTIMETIESLAWKAYEKAEKARLKEEARRKREEARRKAEEEGSQLEEQEEEEDDE